MKINDKKLSMADKMYKQNSTGGVGTSPKEYQNGKAKGDLKMKFKMNGETTGYAKGMKYDGANKSGSFGSAKYNQANPSGSMKGGYDM